MRFLGILNLSGDHPDAGSGRRVWLASNLDPTETVVDLGGTGGMLVGLQPTEKILAYDDLSGFGPGHHIQVPFQRGDVQQLPFTDDQFDVAVLAEVLEHVPRPVDAIREAGRVAKRVLITTPYENRWTNGLGFRIAGHIRFWTIELFAQAVRDAGLDGDFCLLEFGGWSFFVAAVSKTPGAVDRFVQSHATPLEQVDTLVVLATVGQTFAQAKACVATLQQHASVAHDLLVVLDEGTQEQQAWFESRGAILRANGGRAGLVAAYNDGFTRFLSEARYQYLHLLEDGVCITAGWDVALRRTLEAHPKVGWVSCLQAENPSARFTALCSMMRKDCAEQVRGFDPLFAPCQFDDGDLVMRVRQAGFEVCAVPVAVSHPASRTSRAGTIEEDVALMRDHQEKFAERWQVPDIDWNTVLTHQCQECTG